METARATVPDNTRAGEKTALPIPGKEALVGSSAPKGSYSPGTPLAQKERPRCMAIAERGIRTSGDFAEMMGGMMADLIEGKVTPQVGNAVTNSAGKLLKVVEMEMKYGTSNSEGSKKTLTLVGPGKA